MNAAHGCPIIPRSAPFGEQLSAREAWGVRVWIVLSAMAAWYVALDGPFQFDDAVAVVGDTSVHSLRSAVAGLSSSLRPVLDFSYAVSWALGDGATWPFHITNLLLHLVNVELVMRLTTAALNRSSVWPWRGLSPAGAVSGALFALHPIQTEAVTYISGRSSSLSTCFLLAALTFYVAFARSPRRLGFYAAAAAAFLLAVFTKELSATLHLALLTWELCIERTPGRVIAKRLGPWMVAALLAAVVLVLHPRYFKLLLAVVGQRSLLDSLTAQIEGLGYLASRLLLIERPCIDPGLGLYTHLGWESWVGLLLLVSALSLTQLPYGLSFRASELRRVALFGVSFFLLQVFFPYVLLPRADVINERHAYAGSFGLFLVAGAAWQNGAMRLVNKTGGAAWPVPSVRGTYGLVCLGLTLLTADRNADYRSELALWKATTRCAPANPRAFNNLGVAHEHAGELLLARAAYAKAIALEPRYAAARNNFLRATEKRRRSATAQGAEPQ